MIENGILHCHTEHSFNDSGMKVRTLVKRAKELGCPAIGISEHGVTTSVYEFMRLCKDNDIQGIPGVECYMNTKSAYSKLRSHFVLYFKDKQGFHVGTRMITEANRQALAKGESNTITAAFNMELLEQYCAPDKEGHGHVIMTTACVGGIISSILLYNDRIQSEIQKLERKKNLIPDNDTLFKENQNRISELETKITEMTAKKNEAKKLSEKKYKKEQTALKKFSGKELEQAEKELQTKIADSKKAAEHVILLKNEIETFKQSMRFIKEQNKKMEKDIIKRQNINQSIQEETAKMVNPKIILKEAISVLKRLKRCFGEDLYIELQYHTIPAEKKCMPILAVLAEKMNIKTIVANDVHVATNSEDDFKRRQFMRSLRFNKWEEEIIGDRELYLKTDEEIKLMFSKIFTDAQIKRAFEGTKELIEKCHPIMDEWFQKESHNPVYDKNQNANKLLLDACEKGIQKRFPYKTQIYENHEFKEITIHFSKVYQERLKHELKIIMQMGYADYHLIVQDFIREGKRLGLSNPDGVGIGIGPGRGSAAGSLVCYLLGITDIDPILYNLLFERFLNPERVSMPDIDTDMATSIRDQLIQYTQKKYGEKAVCGIMTQGTQAARSAIKNAARLLASKRFGEAGAYQDLGVIICAQIPNELGITLAAIANDQTKKDEATGAEYTIPGLLTIFKDNPDAIEIIKDAMLVEGSLTQYGMHAAGIIISDNNDVSKYVPLMYNREKSQWICECDKVQSEEDCGMLKMDYLGLNTLDIITDTMRYVKQNHGISLTASDMKFEKEVFENIYDNGMTTAVFQVEGGGMQNMLKQFHPDNIEDLILCLAIYRPGPMKFIPDVVAVKHGEKKPNYRTPELKEILDVTYGSIIYQEQIMQIFQKLAGYSVSGADMVRRYMSKKKMDKLVKERETFIHGNEKITGCVKNGISEEAANALFNDMIDFAKYAFNKSHAAAYALVSYQTAWLKYHYPIEFLTANLNRQKFEKYPVLFADCRKYDIKVLRPDINLSEEDFSIQNGCIRYGLKKIKGVANAATSIIQERSNAFLDIADYIIRTDADKGVTEALLYSGAFDRFCNGNRAGIAAELNSLFEQKKQLKMYLKKSENKNSSEVTRNNARQQIQDIKDDIRSIIFDFVNTIENQKEKYLREKEYLNLFVTGHPIRSYQIPQGCLQVENLTPGKQILSIMGYITDLRIIGRKKDGAKMAFFKLEDETGEVPVTCFVDAYAAYGYLLEEGNVIILNGTCKEQQVYQSEEKEYVLNMESATKAKETQEEITAYIPSREKLKDVVIKKLLKQYQADDGYPLYFSIGNEHGKIIKTNLYMSKDFKKNGVLKVI